MPIELSIYRTAAAALLAAMLATGAVAQERRLLTGHVPAQAAKAALVGRLPSTNSLNLAIGLPLRDQAAVSIHLFGGNIGAIKRNAYSLATGEAHLFASGYASSLMPNLWDRSLEART